MSPTITRGTDREVRRTRALLTAALVSGEGASSQLRALVQQSGYVRTLREWTPAVKDSQIAAESVPDVVILDLEAESQPFFDLAARLRRARPTVRIIACAAIDQPDPQLLMQAMRSGVQEFFPKPIGAGVLADTLRRFAHELELEGGPDGSTRLFLVAGAKGGVGTSTVAVNLSVQLRQVTNQRVVLLDFAHPLGQDALLLDVPPRFSLRDALENLDRLDANFLGGLLTAHKSGVHVLAGFQRPEDSVRHSLESFCRIVNVAQGCAEYLVVDAGVASLVEWSSLVQQSQAVLLVAETNVPSLWSLERQIGAAAALHCGSERLRIVINRWHREDEQALQNVGQKLKQPIFARLPNDFASVNEFANTGVPLAGNSSNSLSERIRQLASDLAGITPAATAKRSGLGTFFSR